MKNRVFFVFLMAFFYGCKPVVKPADLALLNGYWEIEKVEFPNGTIKDFKINDTYDYFKVDGTSGTRSKVNPQIDGAFLTTGDSENFTILFNKENATVQYSTSYSKWSETLEELSDKQLVLRNADNKIYYYKKTEPINLNTDGKTTR